MLKRTVIIFLLVILILSGCSSEKQSDLNPITITVLYNDVADNPFQEDWRILEEYENNQSVKLDVILGDNADYEKAIALYMKAEVPPDIFLKCWPDTIENYANDGLLLPISDYEYLMPYYKAYIEKYDLQSEIDTLRIDNGKYYILPGYQREIQVQQWIYRQDIFEQNNLEAPKTYDELFDSLILLKELYPESKPITASWGGAHLFSMMGASYGIPAGWSGTRFYNEIKKEWQFAPATDNYRELYRFLNKCYTAEILDPATLDQSNEDFIEKIVNGEALVTVTWISSGFDTWNEQLKENGIDGGKWAALPVPASTIGISALPPVEKFKEGLAVSANSVNKPYFEDMIKFLDWAIYSEDGIDLTYWGVEGLTYKDTPAGKVFLPNIISPKNKDGTINISSAYGFESFFDLNEDEEFEDYKKPDHIVEFLSESEKANETMTKDPELNLSTDEIEVIKIIEEKLTPYLDETSIKFITGDLSIEDDWDEYLSEIDDIGYTVLEKTWNNAWKRGE